MQSESAGESKGSWCPPCCAPLCRAARVSRLTLLLSLFIFYFSFTLGSYIYCSYTLSHISTLCPQLMAFFVALIVLLVTSYCIGLGCFCHVYNKRRKTWRRWKELEAKEDRLDEEELRREETEGEEANAHTAEGDSTSLVPKRGSSDEGAEDDADVAGGTDDVKEAYSARNSSEGVPYTRPSLLSESLLGEDDVNNASDSHALPPPPSLLSSLFSFSSLRRCTRKRALLYSMWTLWFLVLFSLLLVCVLFFALVVWLQVNTLPKLSGILTLPGLQRPVTISRDDDGIIHVQGYKRSDVYFAQGVVMAQERLWQMQMQRYVGQGRLQELVGPNPAADDVDRLGRVLGFYSAAQSALPALTPSVVEGLEAFCAGINAYLATDPPLGVEFYLLGLGTPEPWRLEDVLVWAKVMSFLLSGNVDRELERWQLVQRGVAQKRVEQLLPPFDTARFPTIMQDAPHDATDAGAADAIPPRDEVEEPIFAWMRARPHLTGELLSPSVSALRDLFSRYRELFGPTHASNSWVVGGSMTESGAPLLCNDPHLPLSAPSLWILFHLQVVDDSRAGAWRREDVIGASLAGVPGILIGRNNVSSWALTNTGADVQDLYVLHDSADHTQYLYQGAYTPYEVVTERIRRKGADDVDFTFRRTVYGPVLSDLAAYASPAPLALHWTSLFANDTTVNAFLALNLATDVGAFRRALRALVAPSQSMLYADAHTFAYQMPGLIPTRAPGHTGKYPVPGTGEWGWTGYVPFDELPYVVNPKQGFIVTANNRVTAPKARAVISDDWDEGSDGYRALRIQNLITALTHGGDGGGPHPLQQKGGRSGTNHSMASMLRIQADVHSLLFDDFKPLLAALHPRSEAGAAWQRRLAAFDGAMAVGSEEATVFQLFYRYLCTLPVAETNATTLNPVYLYNVFLRGDADPNCGPPPHGPAAFPPSTVSDPTPKPPPTTPACLAWASAGLDAVVAGDMGAPAWGQDVKPVVFKHNVLSGSPLTCLSDRRVSHGGDDFTVNVGHWRGELEGGRFYTTKTVGGSPAQTAGPSYRQVIDHGALERSGWEQSLGQSGNLISPNYDNLVGDWQASRMLPMRTLDFQRAYVLWLTMDKKQPVDPNDHLKG